MFADGGKRPLPWAAGRGSKMALLSMLRGLATELSRDEILRDTVIYFSMAKYLQCI